MLTLTLEMTDTERGLLIYSNRVYDVSLILPLRKDRLPAQKIRVHWREVK